MRFDAQHTYYQEHHAGAAFDVILVDGQPAGRLYVSREEDEIRIVDIALLPECGNRGIGTTLLRGLQSEAAAAGKPRLRSSRYGGQAAAHPRRTLQSRAPALRAARFHPIADRGVYLFMEWAQE
jgi:GNAT superfamily N-acetyltransferase